MRVSRADFGRLGKAEPYGSGGVLAPARVGRSGVQVYQDSAGAVREYRPPDEVFAPESLATLEGCAVTVGHPPGGVSPRTWSRLARGFVARVAERETVDGADFLGARLAISDAETLARVDAGDLSEISCGYECELDLTPGVTPEGEPYDRIQRRIRYNHVALGPHGFARAGREARLTLDGLTMIKLAGIDYDTSTPEGLEALGKAAADVTAKIASLESEAGAASARADAAEKRATELEASLPSRVDGELAFRERVRPILGADYAFAGKARRDVMIEAIRKARPSAQIRDDSSDERIGAYFDATLESPAEDYRTTTPETRDDSDVPTIADVSARLFRDSFGGK